jgi:hypothetical protein
VLFDDVIAKQEELRETIGAAGAAAAEFKVVMKDAAACAEGLAVAGRAWDGALTSFAKMIEGFRGPARPPGAPEPEGPAGRPFDIREYAQAATNLANAASELRSLTIELDRAVQAPALTERIDEVESTATTTIDHAAWRVFQLIVTIFLAAVLYAFLRAKVIDRRSG